MFRQEQPLAEGSFAPMGSLQPDAGNSSWNGTEAPGGGTRATPYSLQVTLTLVCLAGLLMLFTVFGNVLVIIAVFTSRALKAPQNLFLVSLASADILVATLVIPFSLANEVMGYWYFGKVWCEIYLALDVLFCTSSIVHLCAISLDRYWSITQAIEYNLKRTPRRIKAIIVTVWVISAVISFPPLISIEKKGAGGGQQPAEPSCKINDQKWYVISSSIGSFFAPCLIMILVYVRIYQIAKRRTRVPPSRRGPDACSAPPGGADRRPNGLGPERGAGPTGAEAEPLPTQLNGAPGEPAPAGPRDGDALDLEESSSSEHAERPPGPRGAGGFGVRARRGARRGRQSVALAREAKPGETLHVRAGGGDRRVRGVLVSVLFHLHAHSGRLPGAQPALQLLLLVRLLQQLAEPCYLHHLQPRLPTRLQEDPLPWGQKTHRVSAWALPCVQTMVRRRPWASRGCVYACSP